jgi:hypothetical protein
VEDLISNDVRSLLFEHIEGHEQLEVLLLLLAHRDRSWSPEAVGEALHISPDLANEALKALQAHQLAMPATLSAKETRYAPVTPELHETVERLARACSERRLDILRLMSSNAIARVRRRAMVRFADAFVVGGSKKDG